MINPFITDFRFEGCLGKATHISLRLFNLSYVSVNSNWVQSPPPPGQPPRIFFGASESWPPGQILLSNSLPRGKKRWSNSPGVGQKFPKLKKLPLKLAKKILKKFRKLRDSTNLLFGELNKTFKFQTEAKPLESL